MRRAGASVCPLAVDGAALAVYGGFFCALLAGYMERGAVWCWHAAGACCRRSAGEMCRSRVWLLERIAVPGYARWFGRMGGRARQRVRQTVGCEPLLLKSGRVGAADLPHEWVCLPQHGERPMPAMPAAVPSVRRIRGDRPCGAPIRLRARSVAGFRIFCDLYAPKYPSYDREEAEKSGCCCARPAVVPSCRGPEAGGIDE